ncbi:Phosphopantothenate--cysteine ligase 2 [Sarracenia purpurea var. burkii]
MRLETGSNLSRLAVPSDGSSRWSPTMVPASKRSGGRGRIVGEWLEPSLPSMGSAWTMKRFEKRGGSFPYDRKAITARGEGIVLGRYRYFLKAGYSVIFLYRRRTCQPFCRSLPEDPLVECFEISMERNVQVCQSHSEAVRRAIGEHRAAVDEGLLLKFPFTTIFEYLQILQLIAKSMKNLGTRAMFYLAAAVSDFYVPWKSMVEHKIQSGSGPLDMSLVQVPKMLSVLRKDWAPMAFCISFKLETDPKILLHKADTALKKYKMHAVVANELSTRKQVVVVVTKNEKIWVRRDQADAKADVESPLIKLLVTKHSSYIDDSDS